MLYWTQLNIYRFGRVGLARWPDSLIVTHSKSRLSTLSLKASRTPLKIDDIAGGWEDTVASWLGLMFLMTFLLISIWFDSDTCQISAFYNEFKGIKNPPKDWWPCWRLRGHWSFLTGAEVPDDVFGDFNMVWWSHMPNLSFLHWV